jgi:Tti2 family
MEDSLSLERLNLEDSGDSPASIQLTEKANGIIEGAKDDPGRLPGALLELLTTIIKPLFSNGHPQITPAGRKPAFPPPPTLSHAVPTTLDEDKPWKIPLAIPLLRTILKAYQSPPPEKRRALLDAHFHLLTPPILNIIDDVSASSKADGYSLLTLLCEATVEADSDILKRTGLTDVFVDAFKLNFMLLPTLTPEDESLLVLKQLYPAFLALIRARFDVSTATSNTNSRKDGLIVRSQPEEDLRQDYLKLLMRHGILESIAHLGAGTSTSFVPLTTFLVSQLRPAIEAMGVSTVVHLSTIIPMLRNLLMDPFGTAAPELIEATLDAMATTLHYCAPRIEAKWWVECLRGLVGCWCNVIDDDEESTKTNLPNPGSLKTKLIKVTQILGSLVKTEEWQEAKRRLVEEESDLQRLFSNE